MRSNERTYGQAIGALDPDKKDSLHNKACQYLADPQFFPRIAAIIELSDSFVFSDIKPQLSCPIWKIQKGYSDNNYNLFGFADLLIYFCSFKQGVVLIEVKSQKVELLDCIQQMKAYRQYLYNYASFNKCLLVTLYPITKQDKATLLSNGIHHVYLQPEKVNEYFSSHEIAQDSF